jgi:hypothetical protein
MTLPGRRKAHQQRSNPKVIRKSRENPPSKGKLPPAEKGRNAWEEI